MKEFYKKAKANYPLVLSTIIFYQVLLTIFFYTKSNVRILCWMVVFIAISIVFREYRPSFKNVLKKISFYEEKPKE